MRIAPLAVPADPTDPELLARLRAAAAGEGPLLLPHAADAPAPVLDAAAETHLAELGADAGGGIAIGTSGSTGVAKRAVLTAAALAASADATHARLGGPGRWLLTLPPHHVAGLQVVLRSLRAGAPPSALPPADSFTPEVFVAGAEAMPSTTTGPGRRYTSLVPTQVRRLLTDPRAVEAARTFDAILVGGSACPPDLLAAAREAGLRIVTTYGMSETCGGCVYDGRPLDGARIRLVDGRIHLTGPMLAAGYLTPLADSPFVDLDGDRWFRTDDLGHLDPVTDAPTGTGEQRLVVEGRVDDVVVTGGLKVWPAEVVAALLPALPPGADLVVVGVPDPEWGSRVAALVELLSSVRPGNGSDDLLAALDARAREVLPRHARPRIVRVVDALPRVGLGKPDRRRIADMLASPGWDDESPAAPGPSRAPKEG